MPSPIAHSVTGYALFKLFRVRFQPPSRFRSLFFGMSICAANVADLDFIPQLFFDLNFHRGFTHSFGCALGFSLLVALLVYCSTQSLTKQIFLLMLAIYSSHLFLDLFTAGGRGMQLLWPLSSQPFRSPFPLFPPVHHSQGLFYWGHWLFISYELLYAILLVSGLNVLLSKRLKFFRQREFDS